MGRCAEGSGIALFVFPVSLHGGQHLPDRSGQSDKHRAAHEAVSDVEFDQVGNDVEEGEVREIQSMACIHPEPQRMGMTGGCDLPFEFPVAFPFR